MMNNFYYCEQHGWCVLDIQGPEARDFLNRITTVNFGRLQSPFFSPGTLLTSNGKIIHFFKVIGHENGNYLLLVNGSEEEALANFEKLHFREKLTIKVSPQKLTYFRFFGKELPTKLEDHKNLNTPNALVKLTNGALVFNENSLTHTSWHSQNNFDYGLVIESEKIQEAIEIFSSAKPLRMNDFEFFRISAGEPAVPQELNTSIIPLEADLSEAVHENKGCYPGQEVIERIRSLGQVPRRLVLFRGQGNPPQPPSKVFLDETTQDAGTLTSVALEPSGAGWVGLGFLKRMYVQSNSSFKIDGMTVEVRFRD